MKQRNAHDAILAWCRSNPPGMGVPCMRMGHSDAPACLVVDVNATDPHPAPRYYGQRVTRRLAAGPTWEAVADALGIEYGD